MLDDATVRFVKDFIERHDPLGTGLAYRYSFRRRFEHCFRVYKWAGRICTQEGGDRAVVEMAALFHDIGKCVDPSRQGHAEKGAAICAEYLQSVGYDAARSERIVSIVRGHIRHCCDGDASIEARIVSDADLLDEMGALTVLWDCMGMPDEQKDSYKAAYDKVRDHYEQSRKKPPALLTAAGREFLSDRLRFLGEFLHHLAFELGLAELCERYPPPETSQ